MTYRDVDAATEVCGLTLTLAFWYSGSVKPISVAITITITITTTITRAMLNLI